MTGSQASSVTLEGNEGYSPSDSKLQLSGLPPIFVLNSHLSTAELDKVEHELSSRGAPLTYDIREANIVLANILKTRRAKLELQWAHVRIDEAGTEFSESAKGKTDKENSDAPLKKRRRLNQDPENQLVKGEVKSSPEPSIPASETTDDEKTGAKPLSQLSISQADLAPTIDISDSDESHEEASLFLGESFAGSVKVVKIDWLNDSLAKGTPQPFKPYIVYEAQVLPPQDPAVSAQDVPKLPAAGSRDVTAIKSSDTNADVFEGIIERAKAEAKPHFPRGQRRDRVKDAMKYDFAGRSFLHAGGSQSQSFTRPSKLLHQTTSEHDEGSSHDLPTMPDWVLQKRIFSCERATPLHSPNDQFLEKLKKIKLARVLTGDEIGVRAYSTSIASIAAYPHPLSSMQEILALPGCDQKIAHLFHEWQTSGGIIQAVVDIENDEVLAILGQFYEIWGVGATTAREFYYEQGWRDLDDIIQSGWESLTRVQQIGLKYYDEFLLKMSRSEVEAIAAIVAEHGRRVTDSGLECIIVGGYRRGKDECGDVDLILSHHDEHQTYNLVDRVTTSLENAGWIKHLLTLNLTNTKRDQQPVPLAPSAGGHGFDTLDKALVVWQSQEWPTRSADLAANPKAKNPNIHRRVDIIISPWRTVGCAVAGWTSGTTFQRDMRRYARKVKGWKFDSSGVRERGTGRWIDLEKWSDPKTRAESWQIAEKRVFDGFGLVYREPWDRCTG